ncbi:MULTISPECIES: hypothetical protein [unclassified Rhodococcus (in: high G+C Gram-positive bacteria)]|nr:MULTISPECIES: hypothetical protein [unclassified Rhodococcus (in: high G+C Gram-positive bacteria)]
MSQRKAVTKAITTLYKRANKADTGLVLDRREVRVGSNRSITSID